MDIYGWGITVICAWLIAIFIIKGLDIYGVFNKNKIPNKDTKGDK